MNKRIAEHEFVYVCAWGDCKKHWPELQPDQMYNSTICAKHAQEQVVKAQMNKVLAKAEERAPSNFPIQCGRCTKTCWEVVHNLREARDFIDWADACPGMAGAKV